MSPGRRGYIGLIELRPKGMFGPGPALGGGPLKGGIIPAGGAIMKG